MSVPVRHRLGPALAGTFATDGVALLASVISGSLAARYLLPEGRGALAAVLFWPQLLAGIGLVSLHEAVTYQMAAEPGRRPAITASALWLAAALAGVVTPLACVLLPVLLGPVRADLVPLARMYVLVFVPFNFIALTLIGCEQGKAKFARFNGLRLLTSGLYLFALIMVIAADDVSVGLVAAANCVSTVVVGGWAVWLARREFARVASLGLIGSLLRTAVRFHPASLLMFAATQADQLAILLFCDNATLGKYAVALTVASSAVGVVSGAFHRVLFPVLAATPDPRSRALLLSRGVRYATLIFIGMIVPMVIVAPLLIRLLFGPNFTDATNMTLVLLLASPLMGMRTILIYATRSLGDSRPGWVAGVVTLVVFAGCSAALAPQFGVIAVPAGVFVGHAAGLAYLIRHVVRSYGLAGPELWAFNAEGLREAYAYVHQVRFSRS